MEYAVAGILIIDDDAEMRQLIKEAISGDHQFYEGANGKLAVEFISKHKIHLLIIDMIMPIQDGINTILELKHDFPTLKIAVVTGSEKELTKAKFFGVDAAFLKPFDPYNVSEIVNKLLN